MILSAIVTKHMQQGIESDHFRVKKNMPASDRRLPLVQYGPAHDPRLRGGALAAQGLRLYWRVDRP
jgi:hypothetical protein